MSSSACKRITTAAQNQTISETKIYTHRIQFSPHTTNTLTEFDSHFTGHFCTTAGTQNSILTSRNTLRRGPAHGKRAHEKSVRK